MAYSYTEKKRIRKDFGKLPEVLNIPDMLKVQRDSYNMFLQLDVPQKKRKDVGIQAVLNSLFPIVSHSGHIELLCEGYRLEEPRFNDIECRRRGLTYMAPLKLKMRLDIFNKDAPKGAKREPKEVRAQEVYLGDIPLMVENGAFVINGTDRVVVSQLIQSPGVIFTDDKGKGHSSGKILHHARIKPEFGSWLEFGFDHKELMYLRVDSRRKIPVTILLRALSMSENDILEKYTNPFSVRMEHWRQVPVSILKDLKFSYPLRDAETDEEVLPKGRIVSDKVLSRWAEEDITQVKVQQQNLEEFLCAGEESVYCYGADGQQWEVNPRSLVGQKLPFNLTDASGKMVARAGTTLTSARTTKITKERQWSGVNFEPCNRFFVDVAHFSGQKLSFDVVVPDAGVKVLTGRTLSPVHVRRLRAAGHTEIEVPARYFAEDMALASELTVFDPASGEIDQKRSDQISEHFPINTLLDEARLRELMEQPVMHFKVFADACQGIPGTLRVDEFRCRTPDPSAAELRQTAQAEIYKTLRPGEPTTTETVRKHFYGLFSDPDRYDLSAVGRMRLNRRLGRKSMEGKSTLEKEDITDILQVLINIQRGDDIVDDVDHLGNRRVRCVGEQVEQAFRTGIIRVQRAVRERLTQVESDNLTVQDMVNAKPVSSAIKEFFGSSQLSQFMDQNNPLAEITHKRRISALGPGGLTRERAGFEVRDVHPTHYGRVCPIETPEGPNIGLINSLAVYARLNDFGFLETPYCKVERGRVIAENIVYLSAIEEGQYVIAQANAALDAKGRFTDQLISCRHQKEFVLEKPENVDYIDVSPRQIVSVAASLIPFLEHDDANRALMGSNMMRQAVPTLRAEKPLVGTGMERAVARDSGTMVLAHRSGVVHDVDANRIVVRADMPDGDDEAVAGSGVDVYILNKYVRSNQSTCVNQCPRVAVNDRIEKGDVLADGTATDLGELAVGQNVLVAFMPWNGYNFEDSIVISERVLEEERFTTVHIEEFTCVARDTKLGSEEITQDIPNISEGLLGKLDECGVVHIGAEVRSGDILVGKVTPKGETQLTPEEKLLRAIFGEKASEIKDTSLRVPSGTEGTVIDVQVFTREGEEKDTRTVAVEEAAIDKARKNADDKIKVEVEDIYDRARALLLGKQMVKGPGKKRKGFVVNEKYLDGLAPEQWGEISLREEKLNKSLEDLIAPARGKKHRQSLLVQATQKVEEEFEQQVEKIKAGSELAPGVLKTIKVSLAVKRCIQPGDKMAGRHGNKGVVSMVVPVEDMPYMEDGTTVDIILNPLGVPSRMNVGQVLETHLGWASKELGRQVRQLLDRTNRATEVRKLLGQIYRGGSRKALSFRDFSATELWNMAENLCEGVPFSTPVFDGASEEEVKEMLQLAGLPLSGQTRLRDGRTGELFDREVTVGYMYMLKLNHLVDDKMHARSTGPYSLVTQQPLGGKAQFGGQRFGEMEVWALEAYGASYTLQEILTVKSDDVDGRNRMYKGIIADEMNTGSALPESFHVLLREVRALGINIEMEYDRGTESLSVPRS